MSNPWSTGLFGIFDDMKIFLFGTQAYMLAVNNSVITSGGKATFGIDGESCAKPCFTAGCIGSDGVFCTNACVFCCLPCVYFLWRQEVRNKFQIQGNMLGDCIACCCCFPCAVMQDARELKIRGVAYGDSGKPVV
eukprot:Opistho-1_new@74759